MNSRIARGWIGFSAGFLSACVALGGSLTTDELTVKQLSSLRGEVAVTTTTNQPIPTDNLVLAYSFDDQQTPVTDESGSGNAGAVSGATWTSGGKFGAGCYTVNGVNNYIQAADSASLDISGALSISAWAKFTSSSSVRCLLAKFDDTSQRAYTLYFDTGILFFQISNCGNSSCQYSTRTVGSVASSEWRHFVVTWDGTANSGVQIYIDGAAQTVQLANATMGAGSLFNSSMPLRVGSKSSGTWPFAGSIDEVRLYSRALTPAEVASLYINGAGGGTTVNPASLLVGHDATANLDGETTIRHLVPQGDIGMGEFTNENE